MPDYGLREDGTKKGPGWLGTLKRPDGRVSTELSLDFDFGGKRVLAPALVPTLDQGEIDHLVSGNRPTKSIIDKAAAHAHERISAGKSPFFSDHPDDIPSKFKKHKEQLEKGPGE